MSANYMISNFQDNIELEILMALYCVWIKVAYMSNDW
jgi:hypothetical protein